MRLTREDWLSIGTDVLVEDGPGALTIERLTERAGITKGSFYHHFGSRQGFVEAFLQHLGELGFTDVVSQVDPDAMPRERLGQLVNEIARHDPALEVAVRRWAAASEPVQQMIDAVDARQLEYLTALFREITGDEEAATYRARLVIAFHLGSLQVRPAIQGDEYVAMAALVSL